MGIGNSSLNGRSSIAWWDAWPQSASGSEQRRARPKDGFEGVEPEPEEPVPPVTVAQVHAFDEEQAATRRGPHPDTLPMPWPATALLLGVNLTQTARQLRQAPDPRRHIRSGTRGNAQQAQSVAPDARRFASAGTAHYFSENAAETTRPVLQAPEPNRHIRHARHRQIRQARTGAPDNTERTQPAAPTPSQSAPAEDNAAGRYLAARLDQLDLNVLFDYLRTAGYPNIGENAECAPTEVLKALHRHLAPVADFAGDPASPTRLSAPGLTQLMRHVMQALGFHGGCYGQAIAPAFQRRVLIHLLSQWSAGCFPAPPWSLGVRFRHTIAEIKTEAESRLKRFDLPQDVAAWIAGVLLADVEPTLVRADSPGDLRYASLEWADLQAGIDTALALGLDHWSMTCVELVALAQTSDMAVRQHPDTDAGLLAPQVRAALVFAGISLEAGDPDAGKRIEQALTVLGEARTARWEAAQYRLETLEALQAPMPTRSRIGTDILREHGIDPERHTVDLRRSHIIGAAPREEPGQTMLARYMGGDRSCSLYSDRENDNKCSLQELDPLFDRAFTQYVASHQRAFGVLLDDAVHVLPAQDRTFWQTGEAQILMPEVRAGYFSSLKKPMAGGYLEPAQFVDRCVPERKPFTAIVAITHAAQTRHYIVAMAGAEGQQIRVLPDFPDDAGHLANKDLILDYFLLPRIDDLFMQGDEVSAARQRRWKLAPGGASGRAVPLLAEYFVEAIDRQRAQAYQPTSLQQFKQAVLDGLKSMIPFYDCVGEVRQGNPGSAVLSCALDVVGLIPVFGTALKTGVGAGRLSIQVGASVLGQLAQTSAKGRLSKQMLRTVVAEIARAAPLATPFVRHSGRALLREGAQLFDPGFQLAYLAGKGLRSGAKGLQGLLSTLRQSPGLQALTDRVTGLTRKPFHFDARAGVWQMDADAVARRDGRRFVKIDDGRELEVVDLGDVARVPVVRAADPADARFVLVEPLQGLPYGPQWVPIPGGFAALGDYRVRLESPVPEPDAGGIIHVGQRANIQLDGEYYLVRHDAKRQSWRIHSENSPDDAPIPVRYDAGRGQWEVRRASLDDLPTEIQSGIAGYFSDADIGSISQVDRRWNTLLTPERRAIEIADEARGIDTMAQMRSLLGGAGMEGGMGVADLRIPLRERPLLALTPRIGALPDLYRVEAFHYLFDAISALSSQQRGMPLAALASRIGDLPAGHRRKEYQRIFNDTITLAPRHRAEPLAALAGQVGQLADDHPLRWGAFNALIRETLLLDAWHRAQPLAALAAAIVHLPLSTRQNRFDFVFDEIGTLPMAERAGPLTALAAQIRALPETDRESVFERVWERICGRPGQRGAEPVAWLDAEHRSLPLGALATVIPNLLWHERLGRFDRIFAEAATLPMGQQAGPLAALSARIGVLPAVDRPLFFNRMLGRIDRLSSTEQRTALLEALTGQVPTLSGDSWREPFDALIRASVWLDGGVHSAHLTRIVESLAQLQSERRLAAAVGILYAVGTLDPARRGELYTQLAQQIVQLPEHQRLQGFDAVLNAAIGLPAEYRAGPLAELAGNFLSMPDHRQPWEFNRILGQIDALPAEQRDLLFEALTRQVRRLPRNQRPVAFEGLVAATAASDAGVQGEPLLRLAGIIGQLPDERQAAAFDRLIDATAALDAGVRGEQLMRLARLGERLPVDRLAAFLRLLRAVGTLDAVRRGEHYIQFAWLIGQLPQHRRAALFDAVVTAVLALPAQHRVVPFEALSAGVYVLPKGLRLDAFRRVGAALNTVSPPTWDAALTALAEQFDALPERGLEMFAILIRASALTTPDHRTALLRMLTERIRLVDPAPQRAHAWQSILRESESLAPELRATAHVALARRIEAIQGDREQLFAFTDLLAAIRRLPPEYRDAPLIAAADDIPRPEGLEWPPVFDEIRHSRTAGRI